MLLCDVPPFTAFSSRGIVLFSSALPKSSLPPVPSYSVNLVMEAMRGLAALWVFLFHIAPTVANSVPGLHGLALVGYRGVPVFFVVSGYCIFAAAQRAAKDKAGATQFLSRRALRIYPTFWISVALVIMTPYAMELIAAAKTGHLVLPTPRWIGYSLTDWVGVLSLTKELLDRTSDGQDGYTLINSVYWTLAIEVQFYLVLYMAIRCGKRWMGFIALISLLCAIATFMQMLFWRGLFVQFWFAFACGILLRLSHSHHLAPFDLFRRREMSISILLLLSTAAAAVWVVPVRGESSSAFLIIAAVTALLMWCLGGIEHAARSREHPPLRRELFLLAFAPLGILGECSYSLYLLHGKVSQFPQMFIRQIIRPDNPMYLILTVCATVAISFVFYRLVERKFQRQPGLRATTSATFTDSGSGSSDSLPAHGSR